MLEVISVLDNITSAFSVTQVTLLGKGFGVLRIVPERTIHTLTFFRLLIEHKLLIVITLRDSGIISGREKTYFLDITHEIQKQRIRCLG